MGKKVKKQALFSPKLLIWAIFYYY